MTVIIARNVGELVDALAPSLNVDKYVYCAKCGKVLGEVAHEHGRTLLKVGGLSLIMAEGRCANCGEDFRWTSSKRALDRLLRHYPKS